jgi:hypothetical protein
MLGIQSAGKDIGAVVDLRDAVPHWKSARPAVGLLPNRTQLGHGDLPFAKNLEQESFNAIVNLVQFTHEKNARLVDVAQGSHE